jgi:hypothetical protein
VTCYLLRLLFDSTESLLGKKQIKGFDLEFFRQRFAAALVPEIRGGEGRMGRSVVFYCGASDNASLESSLDRVAPVWQAVAACGCEDPLLHFMRSYFEDPCLVAGHISWTDDAPALAAIPKPKYRALVGWIKKQWEPVAGRRAGS